MNTYKFREGYCILEPNQMVELVRRAPSGAGRFEINHFMKDRKVVDDDFEFNGYTYELKFDKTIRIFPAGGGFGRRVSLHTFLREAEREDIPSVYEAASFSVESDPEYLGFHNPLHRWNGWAVPFILQGELQRLVENHTCEDYPLVLCEKGIHFYSDPDEEPEFWPIEELEVGEMKVKGCWVGDGWCWTQMEDGIDEAETV